MVDAGLPRAADSKRTTFASRRRCRVGLTELGGEERLRRESQATAGPTVRPPMQRMLR